ncbi:ATP-dependent sacrificial sulfur transferase LarE [Planctomicrobium sp. SH661]|uniref:ATP-dependent sacrificial sulfur transferase LarE n=1 Tax=Planctomicrobium sp. SH661 TaxID=3448124 RepID=UPI003F5BD262
MNHSLEEKRDALLTLLRDSGRVAVAFSGGVDSALVAKAAALACGDQAIAVTAVSPSLAQGELEIARQAAEQMGIRHEVIRTQEFSVPGYQANAGDRCYYCKSELYEELIAALPKWNLDVICNGANLDDQGDHRPGMRAAAERQIRSPLIEAGFTKQDVRDLAKHWEIPVWNKPAAPCLSSRIAYGVEVTPERVRRVDQCERFLKDLLNLQELRVRLEQNDLARIEVPVHALSLLTAENVHQQVVAHFQAQGFRYVTLDLQGFRSGSLNSALPLVSLETRSPASPRLP